MNDVIAELLKTIKTSLIRFEKDLPRYIGKEAVDHFSENFDKQGFVNNGLQPWRDVKRRDPNSKWYGFEYRGERVTYKISKKGKGKVGYKNAGKNKTNFSAAATKREILNGSTHELQRSLRYTATQGKATIISDKPYAKLQNEGGPMKVFGRSGPVMPARPFVGESKELNAKIKTIIDREVNKLFK